MATRKQRPADVDVYDKLLTAQQRSVDSHHGPRHLLDQLLAHEPVVVQGWRIGKQPAYGWFTVHPDGQAVPTHSPVLAERKARILAADVDPQGGS